jgi:hypothetical protein
VGELVQFPGPSIDPENAPMRSDGSRVTKCYELVHVYEAVPGRCQCGANVWVEITAQMGAGLEVAPLLRTEKPKKKWPDDFRGFLSNVRPKKQR